MNSNSALSAWQLAVMAVVPVMMLAAWLIAVYLAARDTGGHKQATAGSLPESAVAGKGSRSLPPAQEPGRPPADRAAA
jgi:hypothetical protein